MTVICSVSGYGSGLGCQIPGLRNMHRSDYRHISNKYIMTDIVTYQTGNTLKQGGH